MRRQFLKIFSLIMVLSLILTGCGSDASGNGQQAGDGQARTFTSSDGLYQITAGDFWEAEDDFSVSEYAENTVMALSAKDFSDVIIRIIVSPGYGSNIDELEESTRLLLETKGEQLADYDYTGNVERQQIGEYTAIVGESSVRMTEEFGEMLGEEIPEESLGNTMKTLTYAFLIDGNLVNLQYGDNGDAAAKPYYEDFVNQIVPSLTYLGEESGNSGDAADSGEVSDEVGETYIIYYEDGTEEECEILALFEADGNDYVAMDSLEDDTDDYYLFGYELDEDGELSIFNISDEETEAADKVFRAEYVE